MSQATKFLHRATFAPEDNKIRIYPACRLPRDEWQRVKDAGFGWAPKQELFWATWTPDREDLALEMAGEIEDEDTSVAERAEAKSERLAGYGANALASSQAARQGAHKIAEMIPFGQQILIGHHSEGRARRDAERIENGFRKAAQEFDRYKYWSDKARGVLANSTYREKPEVIHRRIKGIETDKRKFTKCRDRADVLIKQWQQVTSIEQATKLANLDGLYLRIGDHGSSLWSELIEGRMDYEEGARTAIAHHSKLITRFNRWIEHLEGQIAYNKALLEDKGGLAVENAGKPLEVGGAVLVAGVWLAITRINRGAGKQVVSVTTDDPRAWRGKGRVSYEEIGEFYTKSEFNDFKSGVYMQTGGNGWQCTNCETANDQKEVKCDDCGMPRAFSEQP